MTGHFPPGEDAAGYRPLARRSLPAAWVEQWAAEPEAEVLFEPGRGWMTAGALEAATGRVAGRFAGAGLEPGDRVLFSTAPSIDLVVAHVAAYRAGLVVVPTNTAYTEREVAHVVGDAGVRAAVVDDSDRARWVREAGGDDVVVVGPEVDLPDGPAPALDAVRPDDPAHLGYTSGTTGAPKGATLTHGNMLANSEALERAWRWTADDRLVLALPLFHAHGLCNGMHGTLLAGASAVLLPGFTVDGVLDAAAEHDATLFFGVPTMYHRLAASGRSAELGRLRLCVSGSAALPAGLHRSLQENAGVTVLERYGMTETNMLVSNPYDGERRAGTVGLPLPGVEVRLADGGEIEVRGPNVFAGYWQRPEATGAAFTADGWFRTGDLGDHDEAGYLRLLGRAKELIITGGYNVYPREVEDVLCAHPFVTEAAVMGEPSAEWGETVVAYVVGEEDTEGLRSWAADQLAPFKCPRHYRWVASLPRNALGKVQKHLL
ncbi:MAG TPA: AMP-binding protein [Acidimicrobiales bacterium]